MIRSFAEPETLEFEYASAEDLQQAYDQLRQQAEYPHGPIILPDGTNYQLNPTDKWFLMQLMRVNLFLLIFCVLR